MNTKGKLAILYYERLGTTSVGNQFDDEWKVHACREQGDRIQ